MMAKTKFDGQIHRVNDSPFLYSQNVFGRTSIEQLAFQRVSWRQIKHIITKLDQNIKTSLT